MRHANALLLACLARFRGAGNGIPRTATLLILAAGVGGLLVVPNVFAGSAPTASIDGCPSVVQLGDDAQFSGSGTPTDGQTLTGYSWAFGDGSASSAQNPSHTYASPGTYASSLTVSDDVPSTSAPVACSVKVNNPPSANFSSSQAIANVSLTVGFNASASDADGTISSYSWNFGDGASASGANKTHTYSAGGDHQVTLTVTDDDGGTVQVQKTVHTHKPPTAAITVCPTVAQLNAPAAAFAGSGTPFDGASIASLDWSFGDGSTGTGANPSHAFTSPAVRQVTLTPTDSLGTTGAKAPQSCSVRVNPPPQITIKNSFAVASPTTGQAAQIPLVGQALTISGANATDTTNGSADDKNTLHFAWSIDNGSQASAARDWVTAPLTAAGLHTLSVLVTDPDGGKTTDSVVFRVDAAPVAGFTYTPVTPVTSDTITFSSVSDDPDLHRALTPDLAESLAYAWDLDNNGKFDDGNGPVAAQRFTTAGSHQVALKVTDAAGISSVKQMAIVVQPTRPTATFTTDPIAPLPGQNVTFTSTSTPSSPDRVISLVEWDFDYDGFNFNADATGPTATRAFDTAGPHTVAMRVTEHKDGTTDGVAIASGTVLVNAPPSAAFAFNPSQPFVGDQITLSSASFDPDGPLASQQWDLNGDGNYSDASTAVVTVRVQTPGVHKVSLKVTDTNGATSVVSHDVTVASRPVQPPPVQLLPGVTVNIAGTLKGKTTIVKRLYISAPTGASVNLRCKRPKQNTTRLVGCGIHFGLLRSEGRTMRVRPAERPFPAGTQITATVSQPGFVASVTSFTMRARAEPLRQHLCLPPGARAPAVCAAK